jgi:hypothetical protein
MTSSCCSCHHATHIWLRWPPGPSNQAYLSSPHLEASPATTFCACSSPAPTPVKLQPAPAILSQELVHTTLSITHHTRKRPSTGPQTTHGPQSPPWWVHWQHPQIVTREKRKRKETNKGKEKDHMKKTSLGPLRQGQRLDTSKTKPCSSKEHKPSHQSAKTTKSCPCTHASPPWTNATPPGRMHANNLKTTEQLHQLSSGRLDRSPPPVRPVSNIWTRPTLWPVRPVTSTGQTSV